MTNQELIKIALEAREMSYSPYSQFKVGAALLATDGSIFKGCNIESAAFSATNCAERTSFFTALSQGIKSFSAIAIVGAPQNLYPNDENLGYSFPCGVCRQVMREFCDPKTFRIITAKSAHDYIEVTLEEMLPYSFGPENLI